MKRNLLLLLLLFSTTVAFAQTAIKGQVTDMDSGETLPFATVQLLKNGAFYQGTQTDFDGNYYIANIDPGTYELQIDYTGYPPKKLTGVNVLQGKTNNVDVEVTNDGGIDIETIVVTAYEVPLVEQDNTTQGQTITAEQIRNLPTRNINAIASTVAGATSTDEGAGINIRGSRQNATDYYVDGVRVSSVSIPDAEIEQLQVVTGGIEARYGDVTGGIISITTKGFSDKFTVNAEAETSEGLDAYGNSLAGVALSGPILRNKDQKAVLGYRLSGRYTYREDDNPSAVPLFVARDDIRQGLEDNPIRYVDERPFVAADFLTDEDVSAVETRPFEANSRLNLNGKITARLSDAIDVQLSGAYSDGENQFTPNENQDGSWRLLNGNRNPTFFSDNYRVNLLFRHRLGGAGVADAEGQDKSLIQNANYDLQFTYENETSDQSDAVHGGNFFDYGYVGSIDRDFIPVFEPNFNAETGMVEFNHVDYREVLRGYNDEGSANPILANFNNFLFDNDLLNFTDAEFAIQNQGDGTSSTLDDFPAINGLTQNLYSSTWGFHGNVGRIYNTFQNTDNDRFTFQANANFDIIPGDDPQKSRHSIQLGIMYEQRTDRGYGLSPFRLWTVARQLANQPLDAVSDENRVIDSINVGGVMSAVYAPSISNGDGRFFNNIRDRLGLDNDEFVNTDGLTPDQLSLDLFSPDELASNNLLNYFGYDYLGNEFNGSFDDFFVRDPNTGERTFLVAPNRPIYAAAYLQDKFTINDMIFRLGVRIDRYDANTKVLKDPFSLYEIQSAGDFHDANGTTRPGSIGDDYAVYVTEAGGDIVNAYRNGEDWFFADGNPANGFQEIEGIRDQLVFPAYANPLVEGSNNFIKDDDFTVETSFEDYEAQFNVMPRLSFSFPISDDANFFAHYDVLFQRPPSNTITTALDYFYFTDRAFSQTYNNSNLRSEQTIDYEVGFKTILTPKSALSISAYYKELRDMIQLRTYVPVPIVGQYQTYDNQDFGTVKGFSFTYDLRRIGNFTVNANYTLQFADGTGSNSTSQRGLGNRGNLRTLFPLNNDERHRVNLVLDYRLGSGPNVPKVLQNLGANLQGSAVSGRPYTGTFVPAELSGSGTRGAINGSRKPATFFLNGQVNKDIDFNNGSRMNIYLRVSNILDRRNVLNVYSVTGSPDDPGFLQSSFGRDQIRSVSEGTRPLDGYLASYQWRILNPDFFTLPRRIFVGAIFSL
ncbi:carboxypeptidase regulatory-like domain-containing protein [Lewinella sp. 4G2]|uniref:carboxypeptidase regulatory-like domain-containing protein n=1 Tax=Lewinella sp. 4G2 TaxID=1803372 RepID=UPI0007B4BC7F|nr:carboxypeptidase regulatory-like domain-containing protein [Lewinella sp. 4G2]OAV45570.1 TonB-dependent receptor [Lewinella sp. 4G2]